MRSSWIHSAPFEALTFPFPPLRPRCRTLISSNANGKRATLALADAEVKRVLESWLLSMSVRCHESPGRGRAGRLSSGVLADEGQVRVEGLMLHAVVAGDLEGGAGVVGAQDGLEAVLLDQTIWISEHGGS